MPSYRCGALGGSGTYSVLQVCKPGCTEDSCNLAGQVIHIPPWNSFLEKALGHSWTLQRCSRCSGIIHLPLCRQACLTALRGTEAEEQGENPGRKEHTNMQPICPAVLCNQKVGRVRQRGTQSKCKQFYLTNSSQKLQYEKKCTISTCWSIKKCWLSTFPI